MSHQLTPEDLRAVEAVAEQVAAATLDRIGEGSWPVPSWEDYPELPEWAWECVAEEAAGLVSFPDGDRYEQAFKHLADQADPDGANP